MSALYAARCIGNKKRDLAIWPLPIPSTLAGIFRFSYRAKHSSKRTVESQLLATLFGLSRDNSRQVPIPTVSLLFLYPVTSAYSLFQQPWQTERITFTRQNSPNKPKDTMVRKCHLNVKSKKRIKFISSVSLWLCISVGKTERDGRRLWKKAWAFDRLDVLTFCLFFLYIRLCNGEIQRRPPSQYWLEYFRSIWHSYLMFIFPVKSILSSIV